MVDLLPETLQRWQAVEAMSRQHFLRSGFGEIRTPLLEATDLFCRGIGEGTDVVGKEMYSFQDRGDRSCTLRPEGTASVVCAALQHGLLSQGPQKLWYAGPMFRFERPQAGRQRQFHQIGVGWLGAESARSDVEVVALLGTCSPVSVSEVWSWHSTVSAPQRIARHTALHWWPGLSSVLKNLILIQRLASSPIH